MTSGGETSEKTTKYNDNNNSSSSNIVIMRKRSPNKRPLIVDENLPLVQEFNQLKEKRDRLKHQFEYSYLLVTLLHFYGNLENIYNIPF